jgi:hypothetical protein
MNKYLTISKQRTNGINIFNEEKKNFSYFSLCSRHTVALRPDKEVANSARRATGPGEIETSLP